MIKFETARNYAIATTPRNATPTTPTTIVVRRPDVVLRSVGVSDCGSDVDMRNAVYPTTQATPTTPLNVAGFIRGFCVGFVAPVIGFACCCVAPMAAAFGAGYAFGRDVVEILTLATTPGTKTTTTTVDTRKHENGTTKTTTKTTV